MTVPLAAPSLLVGGGGGGASMSMLVVCASCFLSYILSAVDNVGERKIGMYQRHVRANKSVHNNQNTCTFTTMPDRKLVLYLVLKRRGRPRTHATPDISRNSK